MTVAGSRTPFMSDVYNAEEKFYSRYEWCLNPILSLQELLHRLAEELEAYPAFEGWQREECKINLYLFACAIACTADDYFGRRLLDLSPLHRYAPKLRFLFRAAEWLPNAFRSLAAMIFHWRAWRWR